MEISLIHSESTGGAVRTALIAALLGIGGCMVGPDYKRPAITMPAGYQELKAGASTQPAMVSAATPVDTSWWVQFGDPQLTSLVEQSVKANYSIAVAEARLKEAREARQIVQSLLYPTVGVNASLLRYRGNDSIASIPGLGSDHGLYQAGFDAAWAVDLFGGTRRAVEAAKANEQATAAERRGIVLMIAAETARAYLELRGGQRQLAIDQETLDEQQQTLKVTLQKNHNGLASDLEVLRARTEVESTSAEIPPLQQSVRQYIHVLSTLLGKQPTELAGVLETPAPVPSPRGQLGVGIPSDLLRRRPDIQAVERQLEAATANVGVATSQLFPQLVLGGMAGLASTDNGNFFNSNSRYYATGPSFNWTLFDAGRRQAGVKLSEAAVEAAKSNYQDTVLRAFSEVESALVAVDRTQERVSDLQRLSVSARESANVSRRDYERGILDQLTLLDAQRQSNRADMLLAEGEVSLSVNVVTLCKALGGGWEIAEPSSHTQPIAMKQN